MESKGKLTDVSRDWSTGKCKVTFLVDRDISEELEEIQDKPLRVTAVEWRDKRSLNANRMLWACIGEIAVALKADKWEIYLQLLKRYGKYTYICVKPEAVAAVKAQWRECEEIGKIDIHGDEAVQLLCYFGSHSYDTKEFANLLDGTISEMKEMHLPTPPSADMKRALQEWEKSRAK